jgi:hypothetical protein
MSRLAIIALIGWCAAIMPSQAQAPAKISVFIERAIYPLGEWFRRPLGRIAEKPP